ncbi:heme-binding domain-containing protein [Flavobacterium sp. MFBS3-15]|nr:heme-binding domain-containing protein [Flavobacterium sp. MFBS3-15]MCW4469798.1 heme-binding domain-containing protein [Flavobacterium sp. MFBS3-15]
MRRARGRLAIATLLVFAAMQLYQPKQGDAYRPKDEAHLENVSTIPAPVALVLQRACYDCHSNATDYPLYAYVQPVGWWLEGHITRGREELDFRPVRWVPSQGR